MYLFWRTFRQLSIFYASRTLIGTFPSYLLNLQLFAEL